MSIIELLEAYGRSSGLENGHSDVNNLSFVSQPLRLLIRRPRGSVGGKGCPPDQKWGPGFRRDHPGDVCGPEAAEEIGRAVAVQRRLVPVC